MKQEELASLIYEALAMEVAERVADKLIARQKKALVVYTGSMIGFQTALERMESLRSDGFTFQVFLSKSACELLDVAAIRKALAPEWLLLGEMDCQPEKLALPFDTILVPALTVNTASHLALGLSDTPATRIISNSMMRGKNVIAAIDGCCPDNDERAAKGYHMTPAMKDLLRGNLEKIRAYGLTLTTAEGLAAKTKKTIGLTAAESVPPAFAAAAPVKAVVHVKSVAAPVSGVCTAKVVGRAEIMCCVNNSILRIQRGALITQLAKDEATVRGIKIQVE